MRPVGFSTGALAKGDVRRALGMLEGRGTGAIELSALRLHELPAVLAGISSFDLTGYSYVSVHAPSRFGAADERRVADALLTGLPDAWPIVLHPDTIHDFGAWRGFGRRLCIENMDKRKGVGRTLVEIARVFEELPDASFCFDIGHARQIDRTMTEAYFLVTELERRLSQVHVSEVNAECRHDTLSFAAVSSFAKVARCLPEGVPIILETPAGGSDAMDRQVEMARRALP